MIRTVRGDRIRRRGLARAALLAACIAPAAAQTPVGGPIVKDAVWSASSSPYVVTASIVVRAGATLTIEPGVTVEFAAGSGLAVGELQQGQGTLVARGTAAAPITFTSTSVHRAGWWAGIAFTDDAVSAVVDGSGAYVSGSILEHCVVEDAGAVPFGSGGIAISTTNSSPYLGHCEVRDIQGTGISVICAEALHVVDCLVERATAVGIDARGGPGSLVTGNTVSACSGDGIFASFSVAGATIADNTVAGCGVGIELFYAGGVTCERNHASANLGAGFEVATPARSAMLRGNVATGNAGEGFDLHSSWVWIDSCSAIGNAGCGFLDAAGASVTDSVAIGNGDGGIRTVGGFVAANLIARNHTATDGGGIRADGGAMLMDNHVVDNVAQRGGGVWLGAGCTLDHDDVADNMATEGGGVYLAAATAQITGSTGRYDTFLGNRATRGDDVYCAVPFPIVVTVSPACFGGPSRVTEANQIWDHNDDASLAVVTLGTPVRCDPFADTGAALPGTTAPRLAGSGPLLPGTAATWSVTGAPSQGGGLFAISPRSGFAPALGGVLVPDLGPGVVLLPFTTDGAGAANLGIPALPVLARGSEIYAQAYVVDAGAAAGIAFSNGLLAVVP